MASKSLEFVGTSRNDLRGFPDAARQRAGYELFRLENGDLPSDWKPMSEVGPGVSEIRIHTGREHRVFYVAKFDDAVYVLHAFEKKAQKTAKRDIDLGRARLAEIREIRRRQTKRGNP